MESRQEPAPEKVINQDVVLTGVTPKDDGLSTDPDSGSEVKNNVKSEELNGVDAKEEAENDKSDEDHIPEKGKRNKRRKGIAVIVIAMVVLLVLLALIIALVLITLQRNQCQERERERNRLEAESPNDTFSINETTPIHSTTTDTAMIKLWETPLIGRECSHVSFNDSATFAANGTLTAMEFVWENKGLITGMQMTYGDGPGLAHGSSKVENLVFGPEDRIYSFTVWEMSGRMAGLELHVSTPEGNKAYGPFGNHDINDDNLFAHSNVPIKGTLLYLSGVWNENRVINLYFHSNCSQEDENGTITQSVCQAYAVGNPSDALNSFDDEHISKNGSIRNIKIIYGQYVQSLEIQYGDITVRHGEFLSTKYEIAVGYKISMLEVWFIRYLTAIRFTFTNNIANDTLVAGPFGSLNTGPIISESDGLDDAAKTVLNFGVEEEMAFLSGAESDGYISGIKVHYYSSNTTGAHTNNTHTCDIGKIVPIVVYKTPADNDSQVDRPQTEGCHFSDADFWNAGGPITRIEVNYDSPHSTIGIRLTYGHIMAPAHGKAWTGTGYDSFTLQAGDTVHSVSLWREPASGLEFVSEMYEGNVKAISFHVLNGMSVTTYGPYGDAQGNLTTLYIGRLEYISGLTGGAYQAPLQLNLHYRCDKIDQQLCV